MASITGRFAIVIHPEHVDVGAIISTLSTFDVTPVHVLPYDQWSDNESNRQYDLFLIRDNRSWRFIPAFGDRTKVMEELSDVRSRN